MFYQQHGFDFESMVIETVTGLSYLEYKDKEKINHTSIFDIRRGSSYDMNVSIKVSKNSKNVWTGDILRFYDCTKNTNFHMIVGCWEPNRKGKRFTHILEFHICPDHHYLIWGDMKKNDLMEFCEYVKAIPHGKKGQIDNRYLWKEKRNNIISNGLVSINAKIDSRIQRRVQGGMKISDMIKNGLLFKRYDRRFHHLDLPFLI